MYIRNNLKMHQEGYLNHGAAGYCRIFVELALALFDRGFTVVLPDQKGQGFSGGRRGDYVIQECVENIVDVANWAKEKYKSSIYMIGGSVGGALTYYAAAKDAPVDRIVSLNLFDFGNGLDGLFNFKIFFFGKNQSFSKILWLCYEKFSDYWKIKNSFQLGWCI